MAKTLLDGVNDVLKKAGIISTTNELSSLTNSGKQLFIDHAISAWNESVDQIYSISKVMKPKQGEEDSITLIENVRSYPLPCDLVQIHWPLQEETEGLYIQEYPGGYEDLRHSQTQPDNYTGQPTFAAIDPIEGDLYLNRIPTATEAGNEYKFFYWKDTGLSLGSDVFPFGDVVYRAMVPTVTEVFRYYNNNRFISDMSKFNFGRAVRALMKQPPRSRWISRGSRSRTTSVLGHNPFEYDGR